MPPELTLKSTCSHCRKRLSIHCHVPLLEGLSPPELALKSTEIIPEIGFSLTYRGRLKTFSCDRLSTGRLKTAEAEVNSTLLLSAMLMQFSSPIPMPYFSWVEYDLQVALALT